jgi:hypothetical protein
VTADSVTLSAKNSWVSLGPDGAYNTIEFGEFMTIFRVTAGENEGGLIKYISWNEPSQQGEGKSWATIGRTKTVILDIDD